METLDEVFVTCPKSIIKALEEYELALDTGQLKMLKRHPKLSKKNLEAIKKNDQTQC